MAASGITIIKSFVYRGASEEWSNAYHFTGDPPSDSAGWESLVDAFVDIEKLGMGACNTYLRAYCYEDTDDHAVFTYDYATAHGSVTGSLSPAGGTAFAPGDAAAWVRWKTARTNTNGNPIYLRKYYHGVAVTVGGGVAADDVASATLSALLTLGTDLVGATGDWPGIAGPDGVAPGASTASTFITTRTLERRGKRPH